MRCIGLLALLLAMTRPTLSDEQSPVPVDHPDRSKNGALFKSSVRATLTYRYNGRQFRLTDVAGHVVQEILA